MGFCLPAKPSATDDRTVQVPTIQTPFLIFGTSIFPSCTDQTTTMPIIEFTMRTCDCMLGNFKKGVHKRAGDERAS